MLRGLKDIMATIHGLDVQEARDNIQEVAFHIQAFFEHVSSKPTQPYTGFSVPPRAAFPCLPDPTLLSLAREGQRVCLEQVEFLVRHLFTLLLCRNVLPSEPVLLLYVG